MAVAGARIRRVAVGRGRAEHRQGVGGRGAARLAPALLQEARAVLKTELCKNTSLVSALLVVFYDLPHDDGTHTHHHVLYVCVATCVARVTRSALELVPQEKKGGQNHAGSVRWGRPMTRN